MKPRISKRAGNVSRMMHNEEVAVRNTERKYHNAELAAMGTRRGRPRPRPKAEQKVVPQAEQKQEQKKAERKEKEKEKEFDILSPLLEESSSKRRSVMLPSYHPMARNIGALRANGGGANGGGSVGGGTEIISAYVAAKEALRVMMDPFAESTLARWPDPYTMMPTMTTKDPDHDGLHVFNGVNAFDGATAMYIRGDQQFAWHSATSIASSTGSSTSSTTPYQITWNASDPNWNHLSASMPNQAEARPVALGHRFTYSGVGEYHTIVARVIEMPPWAPLNVPPIGVDSPFPNTANEGPTYAQREYFRAREVTMAPGETLVVMSYPLDALSLIFAPLWASGPQGGADPRNIMDPLSREASGARSWGGFIVVFWGLSDKDSVYHDAIVHNEFVAAPVDVEVADTDLTFAYPKAVVKPDSTSLDGVLDTVVDIVSSGANVFKTVLTKGRELFSTFVPMLFGGGNMQALPVPPLSRSAKVPTYTAMIRAGCEPPRSLIRSYPWLAAVRPIVRQSDSGAVARVTAAVAEQKACEDLEDMPVVLTPSTARRPSVVTPLAVRKK